MARLFVCGAYGQSPGLRYGIAAALLVVTLLGGWGIGHWLGSVYMIIPTAAVTLTGLVAGTRLALSSVPVYAVANALLFFSDPRFSLSGIDRTELFRLVTFTVVGVLVAAVAGGFHSAQRTLLAERQAAQQAAQKAEQGEERFRLLADAMPQLVWTACPDGSVDYYNARREEFAGIVRQPNGTWDWVSVVHPDDRAATVDTWRRANEEEHDYYEMEHRLQRADGQFAWFVSRAAAVRDAAGRIVKWYGTATDIDARKQAEKVLREADQRYSEFVAMLAHELRNPLAAIGAAAQVMRLQLAQNQRIDRPLAILDRQIRNCSRLLDDVLDISRVTRGLVHLHKKKVRIDEVVANAIDSQRLLIEARRHQLQVHLPREPVFVEADPTRLEQIVSNLLNNAIKYTHDGGRIELTAGRVDHQVLIRVCDDGEGIAPDLLPRVFDPFVQADRSLERAQGGLGLGLALVRKLTEMHGGSVEAHSEGPGRGSEFVIKLPEVVGQELAWARPAAVAETAGLRRRILVVEDNLDTAEMLEEYLHSRGHDVAIAHDGLSAVAMAERTAPDVVLLDIGLPGMNGYEVARDLRQRATPPFVIAITGYGQEQDKRRAQQAGIARHMTKPVVLDDLDRLIAEGAPG